MPTLAVAFILVAAAAQEAQGSIEGLWRSPGGNSVISIAPCGDKLCGTVAWASDEAKKAASKAAPQLIGTQILTNLQPRGSGWQGRLFIPDQNMRVTAKISIAGPGQLKVSGCMVAGALCKSQVWTRTEAASAAD